MHIEKDKPPKGMIYPLKSSSLKAALEQAGITTATSLRIGPDHIFFEAFFWPPSGRIDYERFAIRTGAVAASEGGRAREAVEGQVISDFIAWAGSLLARSHSDPERQKQHHFWADYPTG